MKSKLSGSDLAYASRLHKISLAQAKKAAINAGWQKSFVDDVANLDYGTQAINQVIRSNKASKSQAAVILEVYQASKLELAGRFALSQV